MRFCVYSNNNGNGLDVYYIIYDVICTFTVYLHSVVHYIIYGILYYRNDEIYDFFDGVSLLSSATGVIILEHHTNSARSRVGKARMIDFFL